MSAKYKRNTPAEMAENLSRVRELRGQRMPAREIGRVLGLTRTRVERAMQDIYDLEEVDTTPGCARCGLRGAHDCLPLSATAYLGRRETFYQPSGGINGGRRGAQRPE